MLFVLVGYAQMDSGVPAYLRALGGSPRIVGVGFTINTLVIVAGQLVVQRRSTRHRRTRALMVVAGALLARIFAALRPALAERFTLAAAAGLITGESLVGVAAALAGLAGA